MCSNSLRRGICTGGVGALRRDLDIIPNSEGALHPAGFSQLCRIGVKTQRDSWPRISPRLFLIDALPRLTLWLHAEAAWHRVCLVVADQRAGIRRSAVRDRRSPILRYHIHIEVHHPLARDVGILSAHPVRRMAR